MKNKLVLILSMAASTLVISCRKDIQETESVPSVATEMPSIDQSGSAKASLSDWITLSDWKSEKQEGGTLYSATLSVPALDETISQNGLVLVYTKQNNVPAAIPAQLGNAFWYYQVIKGSILINVGVNGAAAFEKDQSIAYVVISAEQLSDLEQAGTSKEKLLAASYDQIKELIK